VAGDQSIHLTYAWWMGSDRPPRSFRVARNPEAVSKLPFLISLPLASGPLILKAGDRWPRTSKVYCHRVDTWPDGAEMLEEVAVRACVRRGQAIDLVLDRGRENRSQVIFTTIRGREGIFWQSPKTAKLARPAIRLPARRASAVRSMMIAIDTRERYPYTFRKHDVTTKRQPLPCGDYGVLHQNEFVAVVERKTLADLAKCLVDGSLAFAMSELATLDRAAVVVEERYGSVFKLPHVTGGFLPDLLGAIQIRYPHVPIVFCDTRPLAEEWTYRFLGAAVARRRQDAHFDGM
jgi:ERCC4 domain